MKARHSPQPLGATAFLPASGNEGGKPAGMPALQATGSRYWRSLDELADTGDAYGDERKFRRGEECVDSDEQEHAEKLQRTHRGGTPGL